MFGRPIIAAIIGMALVSPAAFAEGSKPRPAGINARQHRQTQRIKDGLEDKQLTKAERDKLKADEAAIRAKERVYRKSGNGLNKREYKALQKDLNKTSREIYRAKHNGRRPDAPPPSSSPSQ